MARLAARLIGDRRGGAVIEFAFVAPALVMLLIGGLDIGRMFYVRQGLEYATEEAARYYMLNPTTAESNVTTLLKSKMPGGMGASVSVAYADTANCNANSAVTCTTITARYVFSFVVGSLGFGTQTLRATAKAVRYS
jgi:Flp pilus assembly protein TadG